MVKINKIIDRKTGKGLITFLLSLVAFAIAFTVYAFVFSGRELLPWYALMGLTVAIVPFLLAIIVSVFMKKKNGIE